MKKIITIIPILMLFVNLSANSCIAQDRIFFEKDNSLLNQEHLEEYFIDLSSVLQKENDSIKDTQDNNSLVVQELVNVKSQNIEILEKTYLKSDDIPKDISNKYISLEKYIKGNSVLESAFMQLEKPYKYGKTGPDVFDCSGFTQYVFKLSGITIPRTSEQQSLKGESIDQKLIESGDLIFFDTRSISDKKDIKDEPFLTQQGDLNSQIINYTVSQDSLTNLLNVTLATNSSSDIIVSKPFIPEKVTHVGIYIGDNKFIHASSGGQKVIVSDITSDYYKTRFLYIKRYN